MCRYATGKTKTREETETRVKAWVERWQKNDPYSALAVFKKDTHDFIGHVIIGYGDVPGESELAYLFLQKYWNQGFATEAVTALVKEYALTTIAEGYTVEGKTLERIKATVRPDNLASVRIVQKTGIHIIGEEEKFGGIRYLFSIDLSELSN